MDLANMGVELCKAKLISEEARLKEKALKLDQREAVRCFRRLVMDAFVMEDETDADFHSGGENESYYRKCPYDALEKRLEAWPSHKATQN